MRLLVILFFSLTFSKSFASGTVPPLYESVLLVGDDHVAGAFGNALDRYLRTIAVDVNTIAQCGSTPDNWIGKSAEFTPTRCGYWQRNEAGQEKRSKEFKPRSFQEELAKADPDLTVIVLGTFLLKDSKEMGEQKAAIEKMVEDVRNVASRCIWVGPPQLKKPPYSDNLQQGVRMFESIFKKLRCDYVDSTRLSTYKGKNGIDYQVAAGTNWGAAVSREIEKLNRPTAREVWESDSTLPVETGGPAGGEPR
ncbi:SGNH/GDSL hydrolase family protein [Bdellovibrio sp. HCB274]|uniref:SGNH/GDSL hydrolase family protein n=1 Tax=Bdellovibrio sp. HCB274 TaxID=3394361 RepID=UPI0039B46C57